MSQAARAHTPSRPIIVRKMDFDFTGVRRYWMGDSVTFTHTLNALNMLFPEGERFFIRSVRHYLPQIRDPELRGRVSAFFGQEARHGLEHEKAYQLLEAEGFEIQSFLRRVDKLAYQTLETHAPAVLCLSATVALEHFTAVMAHSALTRETLDHADPVMRDLMRWHACEEIEHKSVAFDVLAEVDGRYAVRVLGAVTTLPLLLAIWTVGTRHLMKQEGLSRETVRQDRQEARDMGQDHSYLFRAFVDYLRRDFHPDDIDDYSLAEAWLQAAGRLEG